MSQSARLSIALQDVARVVNELLAEAAGEEIAWVLVCQADHVAQYVSNTARKDGEELIEALLARWRSGRADVPAHYNPDLPRWSSMNDSLNTPDLPPQDGIAACVVLLHRMLEAPTSQISVGWKNAIGPALLALRSDTPLQPFVDYDADQMLAYGDARAAAAVLEERERCAKLCDRTGNDHCAAAIRTEPKEKTK